MKKVKVLKVLNEMSWFEFVNPQSPQWRNFFTYTYIYSPT